MTEGEDLGDGVLEQDGDQRRAHIVPAHARAALLRKYRTLATWRERKDAAHARATGAAGAAPVTNMNELRTLAREFPGALRELDVLGLPEISRRIARLERPDEVGEQSTAATAATAAVVDDRWMAWILGYHELMKLALSIKLVAGRGRTLTVEAREQTVAAARAAGGIAVDDSFVLAAAHPPAGRLGIVVLTALARHFRAPASEISSALFPPRRPPPYRLPS